MAATPGDHLRTAAAMLLVEQASAHVTGLLEAAGIRAILFKGPLQQHWLAPAGPPRASADVDVLVAPGDVHAAGSVLRADGYAHWPEVTAGVANHCNLWGAAGRIPVEVHWTVAGADVAAIWERFGRETEAAEVAGKSVEIPNEAARCTIVALHAAQHGPGAEGPLHDLERAVAIASTDTWRQAAEIARAIGGTTAFAVGLHLSEAGDRLRAELGLPAPSLTEDLALTLESSVHGAAGFHWLARQRGPVATARFVARKLAPPPAFMRFKYRWADRGPLHLAAAYAYRLGWIARWAVPGFRAWNRSRKDARANRPVTP